MIAVIFELSPAPGRRDEYLALAAALGEQLKGFDGFISIERFQSLAGIFASYRLRVAQVLRDYTLDRREQTPEDSVKIHG